MFENTGLVFRATQESDGGCCAECLTETIITQGDTWGELEAMVRDVVNCYFFDDPRPRSMRMELQKSLGV